MPMYLRDFSCNLWRNLKYGNVYVPRKWRFFLFQIGNLNHRSHLMSWRSPEIDFQMVNSIPPELKRGWLKWFFPVILRISIPSHLPTKMFKYLDIILHIHYIYNLEAFLFHFSHIVYILINSVPHNDIT